MSLSRAEVEHVARLAHVGLTDEEIAEFAVELSSVIEHVNRLQKLDTTGVAPTAHVIPVENVMRDDEVRPSWPPEAVLENAPRRHGDYFEVQAIFD
jgi:aspartyl-tRNA(Asn)/glutamyl-tRNA(Gln) amidotransferase subunit C